MGLVPDGPRAINVAEQLFERELGPTARELVAMVARCTPSAELVPDAFTFDPKDVDAEDSINDVDASVEDP